MSLDDDLKYETALFEALKDFQADNDESVRVFSRHPIDVDDVRRITKRLGETTSRIYFLAGHLIGATLHERDSFRDSLNPFLSFWQFVEETLAGGPEDQIPDSHLLMRIARDDAERVIVAGDFRTLVKTYTEFRERQKGENAVVEQYGDTNDLQA